MRPAEGQIYRHADGGAMFFVRTETREGEEEHFFARIERRMVYTLWLPATEMLDDYELVNDTSGRADAQALWVELEKVQRERDALAGVMKRAVDMLPLSAADELRSLYLQEVKV